MPVCGEDENNLYGELQFISTMAPVQSSLRRAYIAEFEEHKRGGNLLWSPPIPVYPKEPRNHKKKLKENSISEEEDDKT